MSPGPPFPLLYWSFVCVCVSCSVSFPLYIMLSLSACFSSLSLQQCRSCLSFVLCTNITKSTRSHETRSHSHMHSLFLQHATEMMARMVPAEYVPEFVGLCISVTTFFFLLTLLSIPRLLDSCIRSWKTSGLRNRPRNSLCRLDVYVTCYYIVLSLSHTHIPTHVDRFCFAKLSLISPDDYSALIVHVFVRYSLVMSSSYQRAHSHTHIQ